MIGRVGGSGRWGQCVEQKLGWRVGQLVVEVDCEAKARVRGGEVVREEVVVAKRMVEWGSAGDGGSV